MLRLILASLVLLAAAASAQLFSSDCSQYISQTACTSVAGQCCLWCGDAKVCTNGYVDQSGALQACSGAACTSQSSSTCYADDQCPNRVPNLAGTWYYRVSPSLPENANQCTASGQLTFTAASTSATGASYSIASASSSQSSPFTSVSVNYAGDVSFVQGCVGGGSDNALSTSCPAATAWVFPGCDVAFTRSSAAALGASLLMMLVAFSVLLF